MTDKELRPTPQGASIIALGKFNPAIFQPLWFSYNNLIKEEEKDTSKLTAIQDGLTRFSTDWFSLQVTADQYWINTEDPTKYLPLRDLTLGTFQILEHTPISAFGFNRYQHVAMGTEEELLRFGDHFAPKDSWHLILESPRTNSVIVDGNREGSRADGIQIRLETSQTVSPGIFISLNEHYSVPQTMNQIETTSFFLECLRSSWKDFHAYWPRVYEHIFTVYKKEK